MQKKRANWRFNIDNELDNDITYFKEFYFLKKGKKPTQGLILKELLKSWREKRN